MELVNDDGHFAYDQGLEDTVMEQHEQPVEQVLMGLQQDMEVGKRKALGEKIWGPIIGSRQCPRLQKNASKPIMELAQDIKKKKNLEVPPSKERYTSL
jgi:hypothetical protein